MTCAAGGNLAPSYHLAAPSRPWRPRARTRVALASQLPTAWLVFVGALPAGAPRVVTCCHSAAVSL